ncbi:MAG: MerR family transcriptional regulator [Deltaproteobacteria bacterium]|nr:MerR family transcriptional regulator [Deltaproteobacteria bacterium]
MSYLLAPPEIARIEREQARGITSREVVRLFEGKGARFSEATFRKYVQAGLLPRSRRVGRKGKHTGSTGLYPVAVVRRIDLIKRMMAEGLTLEQIRESFVATKGRLEDLEAGLSSLMAELEARARVHPERRAVERELSRAERELRGALRRIEWVGGRVARVGRQHGPAGAGAAA